MNRIFGVLTLLTVIFGLQCALDIKYATRWSVLKEVFNQQALFAVLTFGAGILILSGGLDLSIGSVVALAGVGFSVLMRSGVPPVAAMLIVLAGGTSIGSLHGLLVTRLKLQAFLVTLCGLFMYRGLARVLAPSTERPGIQSAVETRPEFAGQLERAGQAPHGAWCRPRLRFSDDGRGCPDSGNATGTRFARQCFRPILVRDRPKRAGRSLRRHQHRSATNVGVHALFGSGLTGRYSDFSGRRKYHTGVNWGRLGTLRNHRSSTGRLHAARRRGYYPGNDIGGSGTAAITESDQPGGKYPGSARDHPEDRPGDSDTDRANIVGRYGR